MQILLIDDHSVFRTGCKILLEELQLEATFLEAGNLDEALAFIDEPVDLVLMDYFMPGTQGLDAIDVVRRSFEAPVVVLSMLSMEDAPVIRKVVEHGAGFVPKSRTEEVLEIAVQSALHGGIWAPNLPPDPLANLTDRQVEVLALMAKGLQNGEIAENLGIALGTVKAHLAEGFRALEVNNRTEAAKVFRRLGYKVDEAD